MSQHLAPTPTILDSITVFQRLPSETIDWLLQHGELVQFADGEVISPLGAPADRLVAVVAGTMQYYAPGAGNQGPVFRLEAGGVGGALPYSRLQTFKGESRADGETTLFILPRAQFAALEQASPELTQRLVSAMNDRAREEVRGQERDDKLRALGKLSAGLAHELNNPAAAIARAAASLDSALARKPQLLRDLLTHCPSPAMMDALLEASQRPPAPTAPRSALDRADAEDELADWLETQGCADGYELAPSLLEVGYTAAVLTPLVAPLPPAARPAALAWLESHGAARRLAFDLREASQRISTLVGNVKTYSHMDRAGGREPLAVTTGLDSTLNIFEHAMREKNVRLTREYAPDLPQVPGQAGQLNQVWTNLIDNALDALPATGGTLLVRVANQGNGVCTSIVDNGSGIAPEVLAHMFEPFYTTKPPGEGSGLGLDIARRIVQEHGGQLEAHSVPGRTTFSVWLPSV